MLDRASNLRIPCLFVGLFLADCTTVVAQPSPAGSPPANYRQVVSDGDTANILRDDKPWKSIGTDSEGKPVDADTLRWRMKWKGPATLSVSSLRKTIATESGDWFTCLKAVRGGTASYYGISFVGSEIVEWRPAVAIDRCEQQVYGPLPPTTRKLKKDEDDDGVRTSARKLRQ